MTSTQGYLSRLLVCTLLFNAIICSRGYYNTWVSRYERKRGLAMGVRSLRQAPDAIVSNRCVFIFATGRSGSTALVDALNQIPGYLIRGEQGGTFYQLFEAYSSMHDAIKLAARLYPKGVHTALHMANGSNAYPDSQLVHQLYERDAQMYKLPWFHDLNPTRIRDAARAMYAVLFGYHGPGIVSGFKEIRYGCCNYFGQNEQADFEAFVAFLKSLCLDAKFIFNSRKEAHADHNKKLLDMVRPSDTAAFIKDLNTTHYWYDTYAAAHPDHAIRVFMEDMYGDEQTQAEVRRSLLTFLGEDPTLPIRFDRMPIVTPEEYMKDMEVRREGGQQVSTEGVNTQPNSPPPSPPPSPVAVALESQQQQAYRQQAQSSAAAALSSYLAANMHLRHRGRRAKKMSRRTGGRF